MEDKVNQLKNVKNVGFQTGDALDKLIREARFSICPSEVYENCPFSVMESQQRGTPVIGANIGGIPELITDTQGIKEKLYGDYADEILTREDFLNYNELYSKRIEEYDRKITELEAERQNLQTAPNAYPFLDVYRKYRKLEEITRPMVVELIEKIEVYEGNRVEITFRFHDEIADLLEELHQKQMGQHEAPA